ncbi:hypothetical protein HDU93_004824 [Gonapodya sp. JEL0774]|nr:hypothetical protein HDU93_004824 [Gonapodya sp. JEL0774]
MSNTEKQTLIIDTSVEAKPEHVDQIVAGIRSGQVQVQANAPEDEERQRAQKLSEVAEAARDGKLPTTAQAVGFIEKLESDDKLKEKSKEMGPEGKKVMSDFSRAAESTKRLLTEANPQDQLQRLIFYTSRASQTIAESAQRQDVPIDARNEAASIMQNLRDSVDRATHIARLLATSEQFRDILSDVLDLVIETLQTQGGDTGKNLAEAAKRASDLIKDQDKQQELKDSAGDVQSTLADTADQVRKTLFQAGDKPVGDRIKETSEKATQGVSKASDTVEKQVPEDVQRNTSKAKHRAKKHADRAGASKAAEDVSDRVQDKSAQDRVADKAKEETSEFREDVLAAARGDKSLSDVAESARKQVGDVVEAVKQELPPSARGQVEKIRSGDVTASDVANEVVERAKQVADKAKEDLSGMEIPREKQEELAKRWKELMINGFGQREDFRRAWGDLVGLIVDAAGKIQKGFEALSSGARETTVEAQSDAQKAFQAAQELLENISSTSLTPLFSQVRELADATAGDVEVQGVLADAREFAQRGYKDVVEGGNNQGVDVEEYTNQALSLISRLRNTFLSNSRPALSRLLTDSQSLLTSLRASPTATAASTLATDVDRLVRDMFLDDQGRPTVKPGVLRDVGKVVPVLVEGMTDDPSVHYILDNILLKSTNILPSYIRVSTETVFDANKEAGERGRTVVDVTISKIQSSARDIVFYYNKKDGLVRMADVGLLDFDIVSDTGMTVHLVLEPRVPGGEYSGSEDGGALNLVRSEVMIDEIDTRFHDTRHDTLYTVFKPLTATFLRTKVEESLNSVLAETIRSLDRRITREAVRRAREAGEVVGKTVVGGGEVGKGGVVKDVPEEWGSRAYDVKVEE